MDAQLKAKWVEALRSGEFSQCQKEIGCDSHLCCIGVAGVVAGFSQNANWGTYDVAERLGLTADQREALIELNDWQNKSFPEIADYIEANL
jgi:hypothetical protein